MTGMEGSQIQGRRGSAAAFTLIELLVVIAIIAILAGLLMPSLLRAKAKAKEIQCLNRQRQLGISALMYADDFNSQFPPLSRSRSSNWIVRLKPYYQNDKIVQCPTAGFRERYDYSYLINGWNDWFRLHLSEEDFERFESGFWPLGMNRDHVLEPSNTLLFGEKKKDSVHVHVDFFQGTGNDIEMIDRERHQGGSNFTFVDGSVRRLKGLESLRPENLWATTEKWRYAPKLPGIDEE